MRGLVQRVVRAEVRSRVSAGPTDASVAAGVDGADGGDGAAPAGIVADGEWRVSGSIGPGLCVLVGVTHDDGPDLADRLASKIWGLRILDDADGVMNRSLSDVHADGAPAEVLIVSQFTLYGDARKGRRPSWIEAARPEHAEPLVDRVVDQLRQVGATVETGVFRTEMKVDLTNDGPVTLMLEL